MYISFLATLFSYVFQCAVKLLLIIIAASYVKGALVAGFEGQICMPLYSSRSSLEIKAPPIRARE